MRPQVRTRTQAPTSSLVAMKCPACATPMKMIGVESAGPRPLKVQVTYECPSCLKTHIRQHDPV